MSESNGAGDIVYDRHGQAVFIGCGFPGDRLRCAYCSSEAEWACDAAGTEKFGRCGTRLCDEHRVRVDEVHDFCREHAAEGRADELLRKADTAFGAWSEAVETKSVPIGPPMPLPDAANIEPKHFLPRTRRRR